MIEFDKVAGGKQGTAPRSRTGGEVIAHTLVELGITTVFCYPGGANLEILDALSRVKIDLVRTEHEQGAVFAAQGFARASGKLGVCLATSGPGATNLVTGIADANSDSVPILALTGNVSTRWLGRNAFQEVDIVAVTTPITKLARQIRDVGDIASALRDAAELACATRPGPVLLDFPKDVQQALIANGAVDCFDGKSREPAAVQRQTRSALTQDVVEQIATLFARCKNPVIYAGGGIIASDTGDLVTRLAEVLDCPVVLTLMGLGAVDRQHPLCLGPLGMHGAHSANVAVNEADLVLALGVRFDDRVIGNPDAFAATAEIVHIDADARELGKNKEVSIKSCADLREALPQLLAIAGAMPTGPWRRYLAGIAQERPLAPSLSSDGGLTGPQAISLLAARLPPDSIVSTGVGQHQMWAMQFMAPRIGRKFMSSSGFGTMGFGLPAAIGAKCSTPSRIVVDIDGDGSLNMTVNELGTCHRHRIGVKIFVVNNQWLGMVRQWQDMIYARNRITSSQADPLMTAPSDSADPYPDFLLIASGYRVAASRARTPAELETGIARMLRDPNEPYLLDVIVERESDVLPMIPAGKSYRDVVFESGAGNGAATDT